MRYLLVLVFLIAGCVHPQVAETHRWVDENRPKARSGEMKWSDYYKTLYYKIEGLPQNVQGRGQYMEWINTMISASTLYEAGKIDLDKFQEIQRSVQAAEASANEQASANARRVWGQALQNAGASYGRAAEQMRQQNTLNRPITCSTFQGTTTCY